jgi:hypothetical protein
VNQTALNLVALTIFALVMSSLLGPLLHISPAVPAIATFAVLGLATVDTLGWQGRGVTILLDWVAGLSSDHRDRVIHHEAGHFLVAHLLHIPVTGYTLTAWEALRQGQPGLGGVQFDTQELDQQLSAGKLSSQLLNRYSIVWMAGIAAEQTQYGNVEGGNDDQAVFRQLWTQLGLRPEEIGVKQRWATLQATHLLETHNATYEELAAAMAKRASLRECLQILPESHFTGDMNQAS